MILLNISPLSPEVVVSSVHIISATDRNIDDGEAYKYFLKKVKSRILYKSWTRWDICTHWSILTGMWATEETLIYWHIIYSGLKDSSSNLKDFLREPVEQATRGGKFYLAVNIMLCQIYSHLQFWPAMLKAWLDTWKCFVADINNKVITISWGRRKGVRNWAHRTNDSCQTTLILFQFSFAHFQLYNAHCWTQIWFPSPRKQ